MEDKKFLDETKLVDDEAGVESLDSDKIGIRCALGSLPACGLFFEVLGLWLVDKVKSLFAEFFKEGSLDVVFEDGDYKWVLGCNSYGLNLRRGKYEESMRKNVWKDIISVEMRKDSWSWNKDCFFYVWARKHSLEEVLQQLEAFEDLIVRVCGALRRENDRLLAVLQNDERFARFTQIKFEERLKGGSK
jgi:hypothetical protein